MKKGVKKSLKVGIIGITVLAASLGIMPGCTISQFIGTGKNTKDANKKLAEVKVNFRLGAGVPIDKKAVDALAEASKPYTSNDVQPREVTLPTGANSNIKKKPTFARQADIDTIKNGSDSDQAKATKINNLFKACDTLKTDQELAGLITSGVYVIRTYTLRGWYAQEYDDIQKGTVDPEARAKNKVTKVGFRQVGTSTGTGGLNPGDTVVDPDSVIPSDFSDKTVFAVYEYTEAKLLNNVDSEIIIKDLDPDTATKKADTAITYNYMKKTEFEPIQKAATNDMTANSKEFKFMGFYEDSNFTKPLPKDASTQKQYVPLDWFGAKTVYAKWDIVDKAK